MQPPELSPGKHPSSGEHLRLEVNFSERTSQSITFKLFSLPGVLGVSDPP